MFEKYLEKYLVSLLITTGIVLLFGGYAIFDIVSVWWILVIGVFFSLIALYAFGQLEQDMKAFLKRKEEELLLNNKELQSQKEALARSEFVWRQSLLERTAGFPTLVDLISQFQELQDDYTSNTLLTKSHPARKASEVLKQETHRRREAERLWKQTRLIIEHYENIAPFLLDYKDEVIEDDTIAYGDLDDLEKSDPVTYFLTKEEYRKLPTVVRNQFALDRFKKRKWQNWLIGRMYERFIGYKYEMRGYKVIYHGIVHGLEDLGIDLICKKGKDTILIQCKNWSHFKNIYENAIFQFFGTSFCYKWEHKDERIKAMFYTTTSVTDVAKHFAKELGLILEENVKYDSEYPMIKCNVATKTSDKIYHLPFDQQYDKVNIERDKGEFYCTTVKEAEEKGFRRALRWKGDKQAA